MKSSQTFFFIKLAGVRAVLQTVQQKFKEQNKTVMRGNLETVYDEQSDVGGHEA